MTGISFPFKKPIKATVLVSPLEERDHSPPTEHPIVIPLMQDTTNDALSVDCSARDILDDLSSRPETLLEEYQNVPVGVFGEAMLRGMGWNGDLDPIGISCDRKGINTRKFKKKNEKANDVVVRTGSGARVSDRK
jgi:hypothetical protein